MNKPEFPDTFNMDCKDEVIGNGTMKLAYQHMVKECEKHYAAGKADAIPPWPPEANKVWRHKGEAYRFVCGKWNFIGKWGVDTIINSSGQTYITAAYFRGELEEIK
jgi:hypothetical protein